MITNICLHIVIVFPLPCRAKLSNDISAWAAGDGAEEIQTDPDAIHAKQEELSCLANGSRIAHVSKISREMFQHGVVVPRAPSAHDTQEVD